MEITKDEVLKLANLAKLSFNDNEIENITKDMQSIISFADTINKSSTSEEYEDKYSLNNVQREDVVVPSYSSEEILSNAAMVDDGHFFIPKRNNGSL
ncbi:MAG: Asp-tRNA(Asn)/Glu-tRNA(Gln) amidotransferase subunit GatC [Clostridia bacterium]